MVVFIELFLRVRRMSTYYLSFLVELRVEEELLNDVDQA